MKILLATPAAGGMVHHSYVTSLMPELFNHPERLANQERYQFAHYLMAGNSGLSKDRAIMASHAMRNGFDVLLFIDADQSWKWEQVRKLIDTVNEMGGVAAGMVPLKSHPIKLNFTTQPQYASYFAAEAGNVTPAGIDRMRAANKGCDLFPVSAVGTAFMAIHTDVLRAMASKKIVEPFMFRENQNGQISDVFCWDFFPSGPIANTYMGEDYGFCIMAQRAGSTIWVDTSIEIPHHGAFEYRADQGRGRWQQLFLHFGN